MAENPLPQVTLRNEVLYDTNRVTYCFIGKIIGFYRYEKRLGDRTNMVPEQRIDGIEFLFTISQKIAQPINTLMNA
jgi:hypothetical protein